MDTNVRFVFPGGPPSDLFPSWPGTLKPSWDQVVVSENAFKNHPKLTQILVSHEYLGSASLADARMYFI